VTARNARALAATKRGWVALLLAGGLAFSPLASAEVLSIAHRGNSLFAPENTVAAFTSALGKADLVESDVRVTSDGQLVIMHDATVDRTTDGMGSVSAMTLTQIKALDAGVWFGTSFIGERVPTFEEMVASILPQATPLIEHKTGTAAAYVAELRRLNAVSNVVVQSFDWPFLASVRALEPGIRLCALGSGTLTAASLTNIINAGADTVAWAKANVSAMEVAMVHDRGLQLFVWTVNSSAEIRNFIELGVDGIISDDPARVKQIQQVNTNILTDLKSGLVAYWNMDDGLTDAFTTQVADTAGTNHGTLVRNDGASHWFGEGMAKLGGCIKVEGTNAFVNLPQTEAVNINTNALTLSAWLWLPLLPSQLSTSWGAIFDSTTDCYVFYLDKGNRELRFKVTDVVGHAARPGIAEAVLPINQWLHVAATYSGSAEPGAGEAIIYLNGQQRDSHVGNDGSAPTAGLTGNVKTGQLASLGREGPTGGNFFTGFVDDVVLWRRALTPGDIARIHAGGQAGLSVAELLLQPIPNVQFTTIQLNAAGTHLEIRFQHNGPWTNFQLEQATNCNGPYSPAPDLAPVNLGNGLFQFTCLLSAGPMEYFRIVAQ
jgi:glycerophosphoryl diester phosphodiesterase